MKIQNQENLGQDKEKHLTQLEGGSIAQKVLMNSKRHYLSIKIV
jgi:hypothetical protein